MGFCRDIFFLPVRAYRWSIWVSVQASILLVILQVGMTGNLYLLVVQSSACSPTKAPLRRSLQQNVQPSSTQQRRRPYWALTPSAAQVSTATVATPLITIDLQYMARHTWRSCNKFGVTDTFFFPCRQHALVHLLKAYQVGATRISKDDGPPQYYYSTTCLTCSQQYHIHQSELLLLMPLSHSHSVAAPDHAACSTPHHRSSAHHSSADVLRCTRTSLRAYCCTSVLGTNDGRFFITVISPLCHILTFMVSS